MGLVKKITAKSRRSTGGREEQENTQTECLRYCCFKVCMRLHVYLCVFVCVQMHACSPFQAVSLHQLHIFREPLCLFKNKSLKWFLHDLSQQRGQEKSIPPSLLPSSSLFPQLSSRFPSALLLHVYAFMHPPLLCLISSLSALDSPVQYLIAIIGQFWVDCSA